MDLEQITLENGITYVVTNEINNYVYLVNPDDENDFCIRKNIEIDNEDYLKGLDSEEEFYYALSFFKN